jgi:hypothetical protein
MNLLELRVRIVRFSVRLLGIARVDYFRSERTFLGRPLSYVGTQRVVTPPMPGSVGRELAGVDYVSSRSPGPGR